MFTSYGRNTVFTPSATFHCFMGRIRKSGHSHYNIPRAFFQYTNLVIATEDFEGVEVVLLCTQADHFNHGMNKGLEFTSYALKGRLVGGETFTITP